MHRPVDDAASRAAWVLLARPWVAGYRAQLGDARARIESLGPVPEAGDLSADYIAVSMRRLPSMIDGLEAFLVQYARRHQCRRAQ